PIVNPVINGVSGGPANTDKLFGGFIPISDEGDVGVAVCIYLARAHQRLAAPRAQSVEYSPKRRPPCNDAAFRSGLAHRWRVRQEEGSAVGEYDIGGGS